MDEITLIHGDCLEEMKKIPDKSINLVVTDPPYGVEYDGGHFHSGDVNIKRAREKLVGDKDFDYTPFLIECKRLLQDDGSIYCFYAMSRTYEIHKAIRDAGLKLLYVLVWRKTNARYAAMFARYKHNYEPFVWLSKGTPLKWRGDTRQTTCWDIRANSQNIFHPTQKPTNLMGLAIRNSTDEEDIVLDPFMGSGTTGVACKELNRKFIGIEINKDYYEIAKKRIFNTQKSMF